MKDWEGQDFFNNGESEDRVIRTKTCVDAATVLYGLLLLLLLS